MQSILASKKTRAFVSVCQFPERPRCLHTYVHTRQTFQHFAENMVLRSIALLVASTIAPLHQCTARAASKRRDEKHHAHQHQHQPNVYRKKATCRSYPTRVNQQIWHEQDQHDQHDHCQTGQSYACRVHDVTPLRLISTARRR